MKRKPLLSTCIFGTLALIVAVSSLALYGAYRGCLLEIHRGQAGDVLATLRLALSNYSDLDTGRLPRLTQGADGAVTSWRETLLPYCYDAGNVPSLPNRSAPDVFRILSDRGDPSWTSVLAVYRPEVESDGKTQPVSVLVAMEETGIAWNAPNDVTFDEFVEILGRRADAEGPIVVMSASGSIGHVIDSNLVFNNVHNPEQLAILFAPLHK